MTSLYPIEGIDLSFQDCVVKSGIDPEIYILNFEPASGLVIYDLLYRDSDPTTTAAVAAPKQKEIMRSVRVQVVL